MIIDMYILTFKHSFKCEVKMGYIECEGDYVCVYVCGGWDWEDEISNERRNISMVTV